MRNKRIKIEEDDVWYKPLKGNDLDKFVEILGIKRKLFESDEKLRKRIVRHILRGKK